MSTQAFVDITVRYEICVCVCTSTHTYTYVYAYMGFPGGASDKEPNSNAGDIMRHGFNPWVRKIPWRRARQPTVVFLPAESHGQRSLKGYSP